MDHEPLAEGVKRPDTNPGMSPSQWSVIRVVALIGLPLLAVLGVEAAAQGRRLVAPVLLVTAVLVGLTLLGMRFARGAATRFRLPSVATAAVGVALGALSLYTVTVEGRLEHLYLVYLLALVVFVGLPSKAAAIWAAAYLALLVVLLFSGALPNEGPAFGLVARFSVSFGLTCLALGLVERDRRQQYAELLSKKNELEASEQKLRESVEGLSREADERARAEAALEQSEEQLRRAQKLEAVGTLAGGVAHDFNNILAAITGYAELVRELAVAGDSVEDEIDEVLVAADRGRYLVRQILTYSRKIEVNRGPLDLNRQIRRTERLLQRILPKMIEVELRLDEDLGAVVADAAQIEQILLNLATNAKDAMTDGGVLRISTAHVLFDEEDLADKPGLEPGYYARLRVSDNGQGMDEETRQQAFDPFYSTKKGTGGTGLGLATAYGIVRDHGGHIGCASEVGEGTTFEVLLPSLPEAAVDPNPTPITDETRRGEGELVLVVDDDGAVRNAAVRILERHGYHAVTASRGEEALEVFRERGADLDLVVLDVNMPGMGGIKCLERLIAIEPKLKVIVATGYASEQLAEEALRLGARRVLSKPFTLEVLLRSVRQALDDFA